MFCCSSGLFSCAFETIPPTRTKVVTLVSFQVLLCRYVANVLLIGPEVPWITGHAYAELTNSIRCLCKLTRARGPKDAPQRNSGGPLFGISK